MARVEPFEKYTARYDAWFEKNKYAYESELRAVKKALPRKGIGLEVGVGSGRFAVPLGIRIGVDPSRNMGALARARGVYAVEGTAERLPFGDACFDFVLFVTTICFLDDVPAALAEAYRILKKKGSIIIGFVDKDSPIGRRYREHAAENVFYRNAVFFSKEEVDVLLSGAGFRGFSCYQTIFRPLSAMQEIEPVKTGSGEGSFLVIRGLK